MCAVQRDIVRMKMLQPADLPAFMRELMKTPRARQAQEDSAWEIGL
jgi:hypothetical protein